MLITKETCDGFIGTGKVINCKLFVSTFTSIIFLELTNYIFTKPGINFFFSERLSQNPIKKFLDTKDTCLHWESQFCFLCPLDELVYFTMSILLVKDTIGCSSVVTLKNSS